MGFVEFFASVSNELLIVLLFLLLIFCAKTAIDNFKLPPGPYGLPLLGYLPFLTKFPHSKLQELGKSYGDIFSIRLGTSKVLVLNSAEAIREVYSKPESLGRPETSIFNLIKTLKTPFFENGKVWYEHRRFALHALRNLGFGKSVMHDKILEEIQFILKKIDESDGKPCNVQAYLTPSMSNNICQLIFGDRYDYDDPERRFLDQMIDQAAKFLIQTNSLLFLRKFNQFSFVKKLFGFDVFSNYLTHFQGMLRQKIKEHKRTLDPNHMRDFIDSYICELKARQKADPETLFNEDYMLGMSLNFFGAGSETVRTSIGWSLYTMAAYPEVQKKVHAELDSVVGRERSPTFLDSKNLPYIMSLLKEMQRWKTVAPISPLRMFLHDTDIRGYHIPEGTLIMANLWAAHHNPKDWSDPEKFVPERFLSPDKKSTIKSENFLPFSHGKRACPGEGLAITEVYLYFTSIMQKYSVYLPENVEPNFEAEVTITYHLKKYELRFVRRR